MSSEPAWLENLVDAVRTTHALMIRHGGGSSGEHGDRVIASCARPFQSAFGELAYPDNMQGAAVLFHGIITSHALVDGNKRTASLAAAMFLLSSGRIPQISYFQSRLLGELAVEVASTSMPVDEVIGWFERMLEPPTR